MKKFQRTVKHFTSDRSGSIYFIFAAVLPICLFCIGFGVDLMLLFTEKRKAQGIVDIAAIIAAQDPTNPERAAREILSINGYDTISAIELGQMDEDEREKAVKTKTQIQVEPGRFVPNPDLHYKARFVVGQTPYNAARVTIRKKSKYTFLDKVATAPDIAVRATASRRALAAFSVGSRLASIDDGLLNQLLGGLIGTNISMTVLDYKNMQLADIELFSFVNALALEMDIGTGSYADVLNSEPTLGEIVNAIIAVNGDGDAAMALNKLTSFVGSLGGEIDLRKVVDLGPAGAISLGEPVGSGFPAYISIFDMVMANAIVANGDGIIDLNLSASVPGLTSVDVTLDLGEPMQSSPWLSVGQGGQVASNVQARIFIEAVIGGEGLLSSTSVRLPLYLELARASGELMGVDCPGGRIENVTVQLRGASSLIDAWIGDVDVSGNKMSRHVDRAKIVSAPALKIYGKAHAGTEAGNGSVLDFGWSDIVSGSIKTTRTEDMTTRIVENLVDDLELDVSALGLGLGTGTLTRTVLPNSLGKIVTPVGDITDQLLETLGIGLGEGEFRVNGAKCDHAVLVE